MPGRYDASRLATKAKLFPESKGLVERADEKWIGMIAVPKSSCPATNKPRPTYRRGWTYTLENDMRFITIPFQLEDGAEAIAIVLRGKTDDYFGAWFPIARDDEARAIADDLNHELDVERSRYGTGAPPPAQLVMEVGNEHAPDSRFGRQRIRIDPAGTVDYEQITRWQRRRAKGTVAPAMWTSMLDALSRTTFPAPPQPSLLPGGSISSLTLAGPRSGSVLFDFYDALEMEGYRDVVGPLLALCNAIREGDKEALVRLGYDGSIAARDDASGGGDE